MGGRKRNLGQEKKEEKMTKIVCPKCGSSNVGKVGISHGVATIPKGGKLPPPTKSQYGCSNCGKSFIIPLPRDVEGSERKIIDRNLCPQCRTTKWTLGLMKSQSFGLERATCKKCGKRFLRPTEDEPLIPVRE